MTRNKTSEKTRWQYRFEIFKKAYKLLFAAVQNTKTSQLEQEGIIHRFEYTFELARNLIADYLKEEDGFTSYSTKDIIRQALKTGIIQDADMWIDALKYRNKTSHVYNQEVLNETFDFVSSKFIITLEHLYKFFNKKDSV